MKNKVDHIVSALKWNINSGVYAKGEKMPSENALAIKFDCSRLTARKSLQTLRHDGALVSYKGRGYFVSMGQQKLVYQPRTGKVGEKIKFHVVHSILSDEQKKVFLDLDENCKYIFDSLSFSFMKTNFDVVNKPYTVLHSLVNTKITGVINQDEIRESFASFLAKNNIQVTKRKEKIMIVKPNQTISLKLATHSNDLVVASFSIMYTNEGIIELAIRYTIPEEFSQIFEKTY